MIRCASATKKKKFVSELLQLRRFSDPPRDRGRRERDKARGVVKWGAEEKSAAKAGIGTRADKRGWREGNLLAEELRRSAARFRMAAKPRTFRTLKSEVLEVHPTMPHSDSR
jgi:hypothetical protein